MPANAKLYPQNLWIIFILLLPNILLFFFPAINIPIENSRPDKWSIVLILERVGQAAVFILPLFIKITTDSSCKKYVLAFMIFSVVIYYICWGRFYFQGRMFSLMYKNLWIIPIPMAVFPVLYFFAASVLMDSWIYAGASFIFAAGHILESWYISSHII
ncbi:MAG: hypothetical protein AB1Z23_11115 [Eubacteriales bacterium]